MSDKWSKRFELVRGFAWLGVVGLAVLACTALVPRGFRTWGLIFGMLFCLPAIAYTYVIVLWHWKDRYRGSHSDLWGAILLIETTGWMKIVYIVRHLIPDMQRSGRYKSSVAPLGSF